MSTRPPVDSWDRLTRAFSAPEPARGGEPPGTSGVLVPVVAQADDPWLLFTRRAASLSSHPGEISFPGGRVDPGDKGPLEAALRETEEETGIPRDAVEVMGHLTDFLTYRGGLVCAYVGVVSPEAVPAEPASPEEVDELLLVPESGFLEPGVPSPGRPSHPLRCDVRAYEGRYLVDDPRRDRVVHYWHLSREATTVWGITGELLARFLARAHGWKPACSARGIRDVGEFLPDSRA